MAEAPRTQILIVGAGPTGLVLALWLTKMDITVRIIDKTSQPGTTSRALAVQARTLELYQQLGLTADVLAHGHRVEAVNLWAMGKRAARVPIADFGRTLSPYGFPFIYPQDEHERLLVSHLSALGVTVERETEVVAFEDTGDGVHATIRHGGATAECDVDYIAGCDGARSMVRSAIDAGFPGGTYASLFYVADINGDGPALDGELHIDLDQADFLAVFPLDSQGRARLIGAVRGERAERAEQLTFDDVSTTAIEHMKVNVTKVNWFSTYHVHHRVAQHFRKGRAFILGDAAHIHSPVGGQGMNTGIGDAINLAWKLAAVLRGNATPAILDSYEAERIGFARTLVATTDRAFTLVTSESTFAQFVRTRVAPLIVPLLFSVDRMRAFMFRTVGQLTIEYRKSALSSGVAGAVHGGDRLPWVCASDGVEDNFASLSALGWQLHVYGAASQELRDWCASIGLALHVFLWRKSCADAGLMRNAAYLLRPDSYVALASSEATPAAIETFLAQRGITTG